MGVGGYATRLKVGYLGSEISLRSGFKRHNILDFCVFKQETRK
jgi:hypothetical protein